MSFTFDRDGYLARVGLAGAPSADPDGLALLHGAQFHALPFENFDIQLGRGVALDAQSLWDKLVGRPRGGYCFELNGLLLLALREFGFTARPLLGRVHLNPPPGGRTHQVTLVECGGHSWLVDAGFGAGGPRAPILLEDGAAIAGPWWGFRLKCDETWGWLLQSREGEQWKDSYSFDLATVTEGDIAVGNHFTSTFPTVHFVTTRIASRPLPDGRVSLRDFTLTRWREGTTTLEDVPPGEAYLQMLRDTFGIRLDARYEDLRKVAPRS